MKGCRPYTQPEATALLNLLTPRDRTIFTLGLYTGERISAILNLKVADVSLTHVTYRKATRKGKPESRSVVLHPAAKAALSVWMSSLANQTPDTYLFTGKKCRRRPLSRTAYHRALKSAVCTLSLEGKIATHSWRKTFADKIYDALGHDLVATKSAMGHKDIGSTIKYLSFREEKVNQAILNL
jgi:integrase